MIDTQRVLRALDARDDVLIIRPGDDAYDAARLSFNGMIERRPAVIVQPSTTAGVAAAIRAAREAGLAIAVRGGGHSVAGHGLIDDGCVIDLRRMRGAAVDAVARRARVEGGATWDDVDTAAFEHRLALPGGTFGDTGVAGLTLGGGIGWLLGTAGLTCDRLVGAEVVTATGDIAIAGEDGDPELLWALRGGGGNFGIVTTFEFTLDPVRPMTGGFLVVPAEVLPAALDVMLETMHTAPRELVPTMTSGVDPEIGRRTIHVGIAFQGTPETCDRAIAPLRRLRPILRDDVGPKSYLEIQAMNGRLPFGLRHYWKGHFLRTLDEGARAGIAEAVGTASGQSSGIMLEAIHGRALLEPEGAAAFGARGARWNLSALAIWEDPAADAEHIAWARAAADSWLPSSFTGAGYGNYETGDGTPDRVALMFGPERFAKLRDLKRRYDPEVVFRSNHTIPPT